MDGAGEGQYLAIELPGQTRITKTTFNTLKNRWPNKGETHNSDVNVQACDGGCLVGSDDDSNACGCLVGLGGDGEEELTRELAAAPTLQC